MENLGFKFSILHMLARQLRIWADLASRLSGVEDQVNAERADSREAVSASQASSSAISGQQPTMIEDTESTDTAKPPAHWLARIEASGPPAHWLSQIATDTLAAQRQMWKQQDRQDQQGEYSKQNAITLSRSILVTPTHTTDQSAEVIESTQGEGDVSRPSTIDSDRNAVAHIAIDNHVAATGENTPQRWEQGVTVTPDNASDTSFMPAPRSWSSSPMMPDSSRWQEKAAVPAIPKNNQISRPQDQGADPKSSGLVKPVGTMGSGLSEQFEVTTAPSLRVHQISEPMQTMIPSFSPPEETTPNRTVASQDWIMEQQRDREEMNLQKLAMPKNIAHKWQQRSTPEPTNKPNQPPMPPSNTLPKQHVGAHFDVRTADTSALHRPPPSLPSRVPKYINDDREGAQDQASTPPQSTMPWPSLPEDTMFNMTIASQDWVRARRNWERQQRLNEEQRGKLWNA